MIKITVGIEGYMEIYNTPWFQDALEHGDEIVIIIRNRVRTEQPRTISSNTSAVPADESNHRQISHSIWWGLHHILEPYDQFIAIFLAVSLGIFTEFAVDTFYHSVVAYIGLGFFVLALFLGVVAAFDFLKFRRGSFQR